MELYTGPFAGSPTIHQRTAEAVHLLHRTRAEQSEAQVHPPAELAHDRALPAENDPDAELQEEPDADAEVQPQQHEPTGEQ